MYLNSSNQSGYIALMSAIVISVLLIAITLSLGLSSFFGRFDILDAESKERSSALSEACVNQAILKAVSAVYSSNEIIQIGSDSCSIVSSQLNYPLPGQILIKTTAVFNKSYTNLRVVINSNTFKIVSWQECANFNIDCQ